MLHMTALLLRYIHVHDVFGGLIERGVLVASLGEECIYALLELDVCGAERCER